MDKFENKLLNDVLEMVSELAGTAGDNALLPTSKPEVSAGKPKQLEKEAYKAAKEIFYRHNGNVFSMEQNEMYRTYLEFTVPEETEKKWLLELVEKRLYEAYQTKSNARYVVALEIVLANNMQQKLPSLLRTALAFRGVAPSFAALSVMEVLPKEVAKVNWNAPILAENAPYFILALTTFAKEVEEGTFTFPNKQGNEFLRKRFTPKELLARIERGIQAWETFK